MADLCLAGYDEVGLRRAWLERGDEGMRTGCWAEDDGKVEWSGEQ